MDRGRGWIRGAVAGGGVDRGGDGRVWIDGASEGEMWQVRGKMQGRKRGVCRASMPVVLAAHLNKRAKIRRDLNLEDQSIYTLAINIRKSPKR